MSATRWTRMQNIFHQSLALAPDRRASFLDRACAGDADLRAEIEELLAVEEQKYAALDAPAIHALAPEAFTAMRPMHAGERVGEYRIVREIGRGGMGCVYLAHAVGVDDAPKIAVKIARPDAESRNAFARLLREKRFLEELRHPHIAKLLGHGVTGEGIPYLALEFIDGVSIVEHATQHNLDLRARVELLLAIAGALAHAHRRGILHRDLKPSNVLVGQDGRPKLLDFGLGKRCIRHAPGATTLTQTGLRALTPEYASPEQLRGEMLTPASDQYSLAVLAYELLTGHRPHAAKKELPHEIERAICEDEPEPPSTALWRVPHNAEMAQNRSPKERAFARTLAHSWDAILLRALQRRPEKRYASMEDFAAALREGLTPRAALRWRGLRFRLLYRLRIHRVRFAAGILLASFAAGAAALAGGFGASVPQSPQQRVIVGLHEMGFAMHARGDDASSEGMYRLAREMQQRFFGETHPSQASSLNAIGALAMGNGRHEKAEREFREALAILRKNLPEGHPDFVATLLGLGMLLNDLRRFEESAKLLLESSRIAKAQAAAMPSWAQPVAEGELGFALFQLGDLENGRRLLLPAVESIETLFGPEHEQAGRARAHRRECD